MADGDKNKDVVFRRIRGRIVPIKVDRQKLTDTDSKRKKIAASFGGAAVVTSAAGGVVQRRFQKRAREFRISAFRAEGLAQRAEGIRGRKTKASSIRASKIGFRKAAKASFKVAKSTRLLTLGASALFAGQAASQLFESDSPERQAITDFAVASVLPTVFLAGRKKISISRVRRLFRKSGPSKTQRELFPVR